MPKHNIYIKESLQTIISESSSIAEVLSKLNLKVAGGNYYTMRQKIKEFEIDTSHFTGQGWSAGKKFLPKRDIKDYLDNKYKIKSYNLKKRLVSEGLKSDLCEICGLKNWLQKKITLELDHIDGNHFNNNLSNLRILCPNCHSQTPTFRHKKRISS